MSGVLSISLKTSPDQHARLCALQRTFSAACNVVSPVARDTRCWNRVALHHMMYRRLREQFPQLGSQMVCNAIYSVSLTCRRAYQSPASPFFLGKMGNKPLPLLRFLPESPVYFDRHTLSLKAGHLSMFTLDGRMRFELNLASPDEQRFHQERLLEVVLARVKDIFCLTFFFDEGKAAKLVAAPVSDASAARADDASCAALPDYVLVLPEAAAATTESPA